MTKIIDRPKHSCSPTSTGLSAPLSNFCRLCKQLLSLTLYKLRLSDTYFLISPQPNSPNVSGSILHLSSSYNYTVNVPSLSQTHLSTCAVDAILSHSFRDPFFGNNPSCWILHIITFFPATFFLKLAFKFLAILITLKKVPQHVTLSNYHIFSYLPFVAR